MRISNLGYKDISPDKNEKQLFIPSRHITMAGVSKPLVLVPIVGGKPIYDRRVIAKPGDKDIIFEEDVDGVIEMPYAQDGIYKSGSNPYYPYDEIYGNAYQGISPFSSSDSVKENPLSLTPVSIPLNRQLGPSFSTLNASTQVAPQILNKPIPISTNLASNENKNDDNDDKKDSKFIGAFNPYVGWNMQTAAQAAGAFFQNGSLGGGIASLAKLGLEGARNFMHGMSTQKRQDEAYQDYMKKINNAESSDNPKKWRFFQEGGKVGKILTGHYVEGSDDPNFVPNAEVEKGEYLKLPDNSTMEVMGKRHSDGGEKLNLPDGTRVISDYLKIGSKLATYFKKNFDLNVRSSNTFATVLDKFKAKIGLTELLDKEAKIMNKIHDQEDSEIFEGTREMNLQVLSEKVRELQPQKQKLEEMFSNFTDIVFDRQEEMKELKGDSFKKQMGGEQTDDQNAQSQDNSEQQLLQLVELFCQITGNNPQEVLQQIRQMDENQLREFVQVMIHTVKENDGQTDGQESENNGLETPSAEGDVKQLINAYSQVTGQDVNTIVQQLRDVPEDKVNMVLQQMMQTVQNAMKDQSEQSQDNVQEEGQYQEGGMHQGDLEQLIMAYSQMVGEDPNNIFEQLQQMPENEQQQVLQQMMKFVQEGMSNKEQSVATMQNGGELNQDILSLIKYYSDISGEDFDNISKSLSEMSEEDAQEALSKMYQYVQDYQSQNNSQNQQYKKGGYIKKYQAGGPKDNPKKYDDGYLTSPLYNIGEYESYEPKLIRKGKSVLGKGHIGDEQYDPVAEDSVNDFLDNLERMGDIFSKPELKEKAKTYRDLLSKEKDANRRYAIMNEAQGYRQKFVNSNVFSDDDQAYVGAGYAITQKAVQEALNDIPANKKQAFIEALKADGINVKNGRIIPGGYYKSNAKFDTNSNVYKFLEDNKEELGDSYNKIYKSNIADGAWDRRYENFRRINFNSILDRDEYGKNNNFKQITLKDGRIGWIDPTNRNNIIIPHVYRDKKVTKEELEKFNAMPDDPNQKGYKNVGLNGVSERWIVDDGKNDEENKKSNLEEFGDKDIPTSAIPPLLPIPTDYTPKLYQPTLRHIGHVQADHFRVSPEKAIRELNGQYNSTTDLMNQNNSYTSPFLQSDMFAKVNKSIVDAHSQAELANQQDKRNVDNINEQRIMQRDSTNLGQTDNYEKFAQLAMGNYDQELQNYRDRADLIQSNNYNTTNKIMASNAMNPYFQIAGPGYYMLDPKHKFYVKALNDRLSDLEKDNAELKKTIESSKKKKGGLILSKKIRKIFP